jgi:GxxExxY protein
MSQRETEREMNRQDAKDARGREGPGSEVDALASAVVAAAVEVHRVLGPGFLESVYEDALALELNLRKISFMRQVALDVRYKGVAIATQRLDLLVAEKLVVELKATDSIAPIHVAQAISYLKATDLPLAVIINFNVAVLMRGVRRVILKP